MYEMEEGLEDNIIYNARNISANSTVSETDDSCPPFYNFFVLFQRYYIPVIIVFGLVGNLLSGTVFLTTHLRMRSSSYYLAALAMADFVFLTVLFVVYLSNETSFNLYNKQGWCQCFVYISSVCSTLSVWLIVAFTVERFIAIQYPLQRPRMCTVSRAKSIVMVLTVVAMACHSYSFITAGIIRQRTSFFVSNNSFSGNTSEKLVSGVSTVIESDMTDELCELREEYHNTMRIISVVDTIGSLIAPVVLIVSMNAMIARNLILFRRQFLRSEQLDDPFVSHFDTGNNTPAPGSTLTSNFKSKKHESAEHDDTEHTQMDSSNKRNSSYRSSQHGKNVNPQSTRSRRKSKSGGSSEQLPRCINLATSGRNLISTKSQQNITKMLLLISSVFILLNLPSYVTRLIVFFFYELQRRRAPAVLWCVQQTVMLLYYTNFSINFMLYAACGATFRRCLMQLLHNRLMAVVTLSRTCCKVLHFYKKPTQQHGSAPEVIPLKALRE